MAFEVAHYKPNRKPAGVRCVQLDERDGCRIFGQPGRPRVCASLQPSLEMCGGSRAGDVLPVRAGADDGLNPCLR